MGFQKEINYGDQGVRMLVEKGGGLAVLVSFHGRYRIWSKIMYLGMDTFKMYPHALTKRLIFQVKVCQKSVFTEID